MLRFGIFELDEDAGELRRNGVIVRLPPQPFQVLRILVRNSGQVVDRDRLRREIWGETSVDFDRSLNVCVAQVRTALNDDAESPRFIQTLPRRGYRFLASVEQGVQSEPPPPAATSSKKFPYVRAAVVGLVVVLALAAGYRIERPVDRTVRLAVLPFETVGLSSGDTPQIDGLFDELLTRLGGVETSRLRVIGRRSVAVFRGGRKPLREIGALLHVEYAIEATVRQEPAGLRLAVRLAHTGNEGVLWSDTFAQDGDPAAFEEAVVARVSAAVLQKLFPGAQPPSAREEFCRDGWEAYRTGRLLANAGTRAALEKSVAFFEQASCGPGRVALADALVRLARMGSRRDDLWERARAAARNAPGAQLAIGNVAFWRDWDWKTAERAFQSALRLNPSDPDANHDYAWLLVALGRRSEGLASLQRAIALDPLSARINMDAGWLFLQAGRFREAAAQARRALELDPRMAEARACLSRALVYAGDDRAALDTLRDEVSPEQMRAVAGLPPREAIRALWQNALRDHSDMEPYQRAWRLAWLGATGEALGNLEAAFRAHSSMMPMVAADPAFAAIRGTDRFQRIVHDMGL
jgi:DNA-binding winged helix-turn-helix (wHTH) protein/TolB-like protein/thioredoxin-like negative regulator of GroEL